MAARKRPKASKSKAKALPRVRRTADEARRLILDAAEKRLAEVGPAGLRLQDVAAEVGVSHPTVLHHFGSREGLVEAVVARSISALNRTLFEAMRTFDPAKDRPEEMIDRVFEVFSDRGHARLTAWLGMSGHTATHEEPEIRQIAEACHEVRRALWGREPSFEDTLFTMLLAGLTAVGDGICGEVMRRSAGFEPRDGAEKRFRAWFARLLDAHLRGEGVAAP
jgi:AcrR family transcriptional regulator